MIQKLSTPFLALRFAKKQSSSLAADWTNTGVSALVIIRSLISPKTQLPREGQVWSMKPQEAGSPWSPVPPANLTVVLRELAVLFSLTSSQELTFFFLFQLPSFNNSWQMN